MQQTAIVHFPRLPLAAAFAVVAATILIVAAARIGAIPTAPPAPVASPAESRLLQFADSPDGAILVTDGKTGAAVARAAPGTNGFLRGALRGLVRTRRIAEGDLASPFLLARWPNGHLTLEDTATGKRINLFAFGPDNAGVFEAFLPRSEGANP